MLNRVIKWLLTLVGLVVGYTTSDALLKIPYIHNSLGIIPGSATSITALIIGTILIGIIFYAISPFLINLVWKVTELMESGLQKVPTNDIIIGVGGLIIGLVVAMLLTSPFVTLLNNNAILSVIGTIVATIIYIVMGTLGVKTSLRKRDDLSNIFTFLKKFSKDKKGKGETKITIAQPKVLDTSVIIDGRIFDILKTGFVEGSIVIPSFVLEELRHIADSSDSLKRVRGRRGLDILNLIQKELPINVEITEKDFPEIHEVDSKLLKLAQVINGKVITNDFNLNKVAAFQGVPVLNINELANAIKPVVIPGEEMNLHIIKDGKESGQGVAYLDDGTMIVVEGGRKYVGEVVDVIVTSVLQTAAGRMIFARMKTAQDKVV